MFQRQVNEDGVKLFYKCLYCGTLYPMVSRINLKYCTNCGNAEFLLLKFKVPSSFNLKKNLSCCVSDIDRIETIRESEKGVFELNFEAIVKGAPLIVSTRPGVYEINLKYELEKIKDL
nr:hypothetical protein [Candidatus Baldrarchaeota archaeon]